uniref:Uncharacterized protein n=1 Tax=Panagrolaimus sp. JU765 TaxID=591449 RepID=A0AC34RF72_9BILA
MMTFFRTLVSHRLSGKDPNSNSSIIPTVKTIEKNTLPIEFWKIGCGENLPIGDILTFKIDKCSVKLSPEYNANNLSKRLKIIVGAETEGIARTFHGDIVNDYAFFHYDLTGEHCNIQFKNQTYNVDLIIEKSSSGNNKCYYMAAFPGKQFFKKSFGMMKTEKDEIWKDYDYQPGTK